MKILWISPRGEGWALAAALRSEGHKVVYFCPDPHNRRADGVLPRATASNWQDILTKADHIYVDSNFSVRKTRRSFAPSTWVEDIRDAVRRSGKTRSYSGPLPATELLSQDPRYLKKVLGRIGLPPGDQEAPGIWVHVDGDGTTHVELDGVLSPTAPTAPILIPLAKALAYLRGLGYAGPISCEVDPAGGIRQLKACFTYPAAFGQVHLQQHPGASARIRPVKVDDPIEPGEKVWGLNAWREDGATRFAGQLVGYATKIQEGKQ